MWIIFYLSHLKKSTKTLELSPTKIAFIFLNHSTTNRLFHLRLLMYRISQLNFLCKNSHCDLATRPRLSIGSPFGLVLFYFWNDHTEIEEIWLGLKVNSVRENRKYFLNYGRWVFTYNPDKWKLVSKTENKVCLLS